MPAVTKYRVGSIVVALTAAVLLTTLHRFDQVVGTVVDPCAAPVNAIVCENSKPGNPKGEWDLPGAWPQYGDLNILGVVAELSVTAGETVHFKVNRSAAAYRIDIYRLGYYAGLGARKVATVRPSVSLPQTWSSRLPPRRRPACPRRLFRLRKLTCRGNPSMVRAPTGSSTLRLKRRGPQSPPPRRHRLAIPACRRIRLISIR